MDEEMISIQDLESRRDILFVTLQSSENTLKEIKERAKVMKQEIANIKGAIIELDTLIENGPKI